MLIIPFLDYALIFLYNIFLFWHTHMHTFKYITNSDIGQCRQINLNDVDKLHETKYS